MWGLGYRRRLHRFGSAGFVLPCGFVRFYLLLPLGAFFFRFRLTLILQLQIPSRQCLKGIRSLLRTGRVLSGQFYHTRL